MMYCINMVELIFFKITVRLYIRLAMNFRNTVYHLGTSKILTFTVFHANLEKIEKYLYKDDMHLN